MSEGSKECAPEALVTQATVLVVDDTPENIVLLSEVLRDDYRVKVANCGERALRIAASDDKPDLILLDLGLPGTDGRAILDQLRSSSELSHVPVVVVTGESNPQELESTLGGSVQGVVPKPLQLQTFLDLVERLRVHWKADMILPRPANEV